MIRLVHPVAASIALMTILLFWISTVASELLGTHEAVIFVKSSIPWGLFVLIPCLAVTGGTGFKMAQRWNAPLVLAKKRRMPIIAINGLFVLTPCALALSHLAQAHRFGPLFVTVQAIELAAGAANVLLMAMSFRDGLRLRGRIAMPPRTLK